MSLVDSVLARRAGQAAKLGSDGARAEEMAARYLQQRGMRIVARNFRCRGGEIDLIGEHKGTIVFVEVRLRQTEAFGGAAASISPAKQARVTLAARHWLHTAGKHWTGRPTRFDAVLFDRLDLAAARWIQAAFNVDGRG